MSKLKRFIKYVVRYYPKVYVSNDVKCPKCNTYCKIVFVVGHKKSLFHKDKFYNEYGCTSCGKVWREYL